MSQQDSEITDITQQELVEMLKQAEKRGRLDGYNEGYAAAIAIARHHMYQLPQEPPTDVSVFYEPLVQEAYAKVPLDSKIEVLQLTLKSCNNLKRRGLHTVGDIMKYAQSGYFESIRNFTHLDHDKLLRSLRENGYTFGPSWPGAVPPLRRFL